MLAVRRSFGSGSWCRRWQLLRSRWLQTPTMIALAVALVVALVVVVVGLP